jgi:predicted RNA binding protein YcfA (HicA-like mRNA interferase family)
MKYGELMQLLEKDGWVMVRKSGSHIIMIHSVKAGRIIIPFHSGKEVKKGLLIAIIKQTGIKTAKR